MTCAVVDHRRAQPRRSTSKPASGSPPARTHTNLVAHLDVGLVGLQPPGGRSLDDDERLQLLPRRRSNAAVRLTTARRGSCRCPGRDGAVGRDGRGRCRGATPEEHLGSGAPQAAMVAVPWPMRQAPVKRGHAAVEIQHPAATWRRGSRRSSAWASRCLRRCATGGGPGRSRRPTPCAFRSSRAALTSGIRAGRSSGCSARTSCGTAAAATGCAGAPRTSRAEFGHAMSMSSASTRRARCRPCRAHAPAAARLCRLVQTPGVVRLIAGICCSPCISARCEGSS